MSTWINNNNALKDLCDQLADSQLIALDTEFIRTDTYYPKIALIQLSDGETIWLVDVLSVDDFLPLKKLLESPDNTLIFHACAEDLEVLDHAINIQPTQIFDTQIAAGIVNIGYSMGYARLVDSLLDIQLDKQETRSNWLARPLTQRQLDYATVDVLHLHSLYSILVEMLNQQERFKWFEEETKGLFKVVDQRKNNQDYYTRIRGAWRLDAQSLTTLRHLCRWREALSRSKDVPKSRIAKDNVLFDIAKKMPRSKQQLHSIDDWHPGSIRRYGELVLKEIEVSLSQNHDAWVPQPLSSSLNAISKNIRKLLVEIAEEQKIPQEFLANKRELEDILRSSQQGQYQLPDRIKQGWRQQWVQPAIESELSKANLTCES
ncbi:MAG: ribonuclease D [Porticoccaceae bacterium]